MTPIYSDHSQNFPVVQKVNVDRDDQGFLFLVLIFWWSQQSTETLKIGIGISTSASALKQFSIGNIFWLHLGSYPKLISGLQNPISTIILIVFVSIWTLLKLAEFYSANIYLLQVNNRNTRNRCEIWSTLTMKTPDRRH